MAFHLIHLMDVKIAPEHQPSPTPSRAIHGFALYVTTYILLGAEILIVDRARPLYLIRSSCNWIAV